MWESAERLEIDREERDVLQRLLRDGRSPQRVAFRVRIILAAAEGVSNNQAARDLRTSRPTILRWRERFEELGVEGLLQDAPRPGRKKSLGRSKEREIVRTTLYRKPKDATHWSVRSLAKAQGVSPATVYRIWRKHGLQPHRVKSFKLSTDPEFFEKLEDIVGLYLNPPQKALVFSVDEKSQIQALERSQPILPLRPGLPERQTHDYERHGTTTLFAALNVLDGKVIGSCLPRHRHSEFLRFLEHLDRQIPKKREVHLILDNYGTHTHPTVQAWFAARPRYHLHFTPTGASWLNLVERFFAEITRKRIRRGTFASLGELIRAIRDYIRHHNNDPKPFVWTATAKSIRGKIRRIVTER
jgi:transposase